MDEPWKGVHLLSGLFSGFFAIVFAWSRTREPIRQSKRMGIPN